MLSDKMKLSFFLNRSLFAGCLVTQYVAAFQGPGPLPPGVDKVKLIVTNDDPRQSFAFKLDKLLDSLQGVSFVRKNKNNLFLKGNYAPVAEEHRGVPLVEVVEGSIPHALDGIFVRNGPNPLPGQTSKPYHWFDGHGMLHSVRLKNGQATYTNSFIPTPRYQLEKVLGEEYFSRMGEFGKDMTGFIKAMYVQNNLAKAAGLEKLHSYTGNNNAIMSPSTQLGSL